MTSSAKLSATRQFTVIDLFAGSCNTLYWNLRHVPNMESLALEFDRQVYELRKRNIARLDRKIELAHGEYQSLLTGRHLPPDHALIVFVAPPWGTAVDETTGLGTGLRRQSPTSLARSSALIRTTRYCSRPR